MSSTVGDFICLSRNFLSQGFRSLPVLLGGSVFFLGMAQGNFNLMFFFVGMFILTPLAAILINGLWELLFANTPEWLTVPIDMWQLPAASAEACNIFTVGAGASVTTLNVVPSFWMSMIAFFFTYLFANASALYEKQETSKAPKTAVAARKSQAMVSMIVVIGLAVLTTILRYGTSCETGLGILVSWILGYSLGYGWYKFMRSCGLGRLDDLFGITNRILPQQSYEDLDPTVCVAT